MVEALQNYATARPTDSKEKLRLAYGCVLLEQIERAKTVLQKIDPQAIKFNADYPFCIGAIAQWEGKTGKAIKHMEKAISMRRYKPIYHLKLGQLYLSRGQLDRAQKALEWAAKIDPGEKIKEEAQMLLSEIDQE
jgi:tetratricopeptide (TPR) repeat protein